MPDRLALRVPASDDGLRLTAAACDRFCQEHAVPGETAWRLQVVLDEVLSNVVRHACVGREGGAGAIDLRLEFRAPAITVVVADEGPAFDPLGQPAPDTRAPLEARRPGGLGIALVRSLGDEVRYERRAGRNELTITFREVAGSRG